jgi:hypothetical protein
VVTWHETLGRAPTILSSEGKPEGRLISQLASPIPLGAAQAVRLAVSVKNHSARRRQAMSQLGGERALAERREWVG